MNENILVTVGANISGMQKGLKQAADDINSFSSKMTDVGKKMSGIGKSMTGFVTLPLLGAAASFVTFASSQETAFAKVSTLLDESVTDFDAYKKDIRKWSNDLGVSFDEYSEAVYQSISAGVAQGKAIEFAGKMAKLAKGGFTDMATASDVVTTAINAYGLSIEETDGIMDQLINTQNLGKTTVGELADSMGKVIPVASAQGVSFSELSASYAALTKNGIATAEAGTYMKAMFSELGKAGSDVDKILREKTGKSFSELQAAGKDTGDILATLSEHAEKNDLKLSDLFGSVEAGSAALVLAKNGGKEYTDILASMGDVAGATEAAFEKVSGAAGEKMAKAFVNLKNAGATFGDLILPTVVKVVEKITELAEWFMTLDKRVMTTILVVGGIVAAIGPLLWMLGTAITTFGVISAAVTAAGGVMAILGTVFAALTGPIAIAVAAVVGIIAVLVLAYNKVDWFRNAVNTAWQAIKDATMVAFDYVKGIITTVMADVMVLVGDVLGKLKAFWSEHGAQITAMVQLYFGVIFEYIKLVMNGIKSLFQAVWPIISGLVKIAWGIIQLAVKNGLDIILGLVGTVMKLLKGDWKGAWDSILGIAENIWNNIQGFFEKVDLLQIGKDMIDGLIQGIESMVDGVSAAIRNIANIIPAGIKKILGIFSPSRVLAKLGMYTGMGLANGLDGEVSSVEKSAQALANAAVAKPTLSYNTPSGSHASFSSALSGQVDVSVNEQSGLLREIVYAIREGQVITLNGRKVGESVADAVGETLQRRSDMSRIGAGKPRKSLF